MYGHFILYNINIELGGDRRETGWSGTVLSMMEKEEVNSRINVLAILTVSLRICSVISD